MSDVRGAGAPRLLILTGMSGAGRTSVARLLEDLGFFVVDNLPPALIGEMVSMNDLADEPRRLAVVVDTRAGFPLERLQATLNDLDWQGVSSVLLFVDAARETLVNRYEENRRPHPVEGATIGESIDRERELMADLRAAANMIIDTTDLNVHELRERVESLFSQEGPPRPMRVSLTSFGFKHGSPRDADLLFDVRFLPNPHWEAELRPLTGDDEPVRRYVLDSDDARDFVERVTELLGFVLPRYQAEGKSYLSIGIGCTGGRHRSVAIAGALHDWLEEQGIESAVRHRDMAR